MDLTRSARKIALTLFLAMSFGSAALIAAGTVNPIVGADLSGTPAWAGAPGSLLTLGTALAALVLGLLMERVGRRWGMMIGLALGLIGAGMAFKSVIDRSFLWFLAGIALTGGGQAALQLGRFAAADVYPPERRGRAISNVVIGGTVGAILGPWLVGPMGLLTARSGLSELSGAYLAEFVLFGLVIAGIFIFLRPDPREISRQMSRSHSADQDSAESSRPLGQIVREPTSIVAISAMAIGQMVMVMVMGITALHMKNHQHALTDISLVISAHTFGMFAFSIISGQLADRWGRGPVILIGLATLMLSCLLAPLSPDVVPLAFALFLLGLGWNFSYVGGSALLSDQLTPGERARTQGFNDLIIGLASAIGSFSSGLVFAAQGYGLVGTIGLILTLVPFGLAVWWLAGERRVAAAVR